MDASDQVLQITAADRLKVADAAAHLGYRVAPADVASATGFSLIKTEFILKNLISVTGGALEADRSGSLVYSFNPGFRNLLQDHRFRERLRPLLVPVYKLASYLLRCFIGFMLAISPVCLIAFFTMAGMGDPLTADRRKGKYSVTVLDLLYPFISLFKWRYRPGDYEYLPSFFRERKQANTSFGYDIITFMIGTGTGTGTGSDSDTGSALEENRRWSLIANLIRQNQGVVIAEQLAPYLESGKADTESITPVLVRFNGYPTICESGNTVYVFPAMQISARAESGDKISPYFKREKMIFSSARGARATFLWSFALCNLVFYLLLYRLYIDNPIVTPSAIFLLIYIGFGLLFAMLPTLRWLSVTVNNHLIQKRNKKREEASRLLETEDLEARLTEAREHELNMQILDGSGIEYHTDSTLLEQEFGDNIPAYIRSGEITITIEPVFYDAFLTVTKTLDRDSITIFPQVPENAERLLYLSGLYKSVPVTLKLVYHEFDYHELTVTIKSEYKLHLEICKNIFDQPLDQLIEGRAETTFYPRRGPLTLFKRYRIFAASGKLIPEWFLLDKTLKDNILPLFKSFRVHLLVINKGLSAHGRVAGLRDFDQFLNHLYLANLRIEEECNRPYQ